MNLLYVISLIAGLLGSTFSFVRTQPLVSELDTVVLRKLRWANTKNDVRVILGNQVSLRSASDTTLEYEDRALGLQTHVLLVFDKRRDQLSSAKVGFRTADAREFEMILKRLTERLGEPNHHRKKEEKKIVGTMTMEINSWKTKAAFITLSHFSLNAKTLEVALFFSDPSH